MSKLQSYSYLHTKQTMLIGSGRLVAPSRAHQECCSKVCVCVWRGGGATYRGGCGEYLPPSPPPPNLPYCRQRYSYPSTGRAGSPPIYTTVYGSLTNTRSPKPQAKEKTGGFMFVFSPLPSDIVFVPPPSGFPPPHPTGSRPTPTPESQTAVNRTQDAFFQLGFFSFNLIRQENR